MLITFEGLDGTGKTTQVEMLTKFFEDMKYSVLTTHEPGGCEISEQIRTILLDPNNKDMTCTTEMLLYAASRSQHIEKVIIPALNCGHIVICSRFIDSMIAYQGYGRQMDIDNMLNVIDDITEGIRPQLTFLLDMPVKHAMKRMDKLEKDRIEKEDVAFYGRVRKGFHELAKQNNNRIFTVNARLDADYIANMISIKAENALHEWEEQMEDSIPFGDENNIEEDPIEIMDTNIIRVIDRERQDIKEGNTVMWDIVRGKRIAKQQEGKHAKG